MSHTDSQRLIDRGRKAGLSTSELYSALATCPPEAGQRSAEQVDGNGFVAGCGQNGQRVYCPAGTPRQA